MNKIKVTVFLATYNGEKFICDQLSSINSQVDVDVKIYFSDNGSIDNTKSLLERYPNCIDVSPTNCDRGAAENFLYLLEKSKDLNLDDYIFLSDQDDIWLPTKMKRAIEILDKGFECYSGSYYQYQSNKSSKSLKYINKRFNKQKLTGSFRSPGPGFTYAFQRKSFEDIAKSSYLRKFFPYTKLKVRWHDWLLYWVALELGKKWFIDNQAHALYRLHNNNDTGQITSLKQFWDRLIYVISGNFFCEVSLLASFRTDEISETIRANGIFAFLKVIFLIFSIERNTLSKVSIVASLISYKTKSLFKGNR